MDFVIENGSAIIAGVSALIALGAMWAAISQARSAKGSRKAADAAVVEARRSAEADETMARLAQEEASRYKVPWRIEHISNQAHRLVNDSDEEALNVRISGAVLTREFEDRGTILARASVKLIKIGSHSSDEDLRIVWQRPDGSTHAWKYAL